MKFGLFWQVPGHESSSVPRRHWETIEEIVLADRLGFDQAWLAESPFFPTRPMSQPLLVIAAAAQHARRIRFGTLATQTPLHHPVDFATAVSTCDILTEGRLELCLGGRFGGASSQILGVSPDIDSETSRQMVSEFTRLIREAWTNDRLSFEGTFWQLKDVPLIPQPIQTPGPPLLMAANSDGSFSFAAGEGLGVVGTTLSQPLSKLKEHSLTFSTEINPEKAAGNPQVFNVAISFFVSESREKAREQMSKNWLDKDVIGTGSPTRPSAIGGGRHDFSTGYGGWATWDFDTATQYCIYDSPEGCVERLLEIKNNIPSLNQCILEFNRRGRLTTEEVRESMQLFADSVMPEFV